MPESILTDQAETGGHQLTDALQAHCDAIADEHARLTDLVRDLRGVFFGEPSDQRQVCAEYGIDWDERGNWFPTIFPMLQTELDQVMTEVHAPRDAKPPRSAVVIAMPHIVIHPEPRP